jgi:hypothetical protein
LLTEKHIKQFAVYYLTCFIVCYAWYFYHGLLFSSINPVFFLNRLDVSHNIIMLTNLQNFLLQSRLLRIIFDLLFLLLPVLLFYTIVKNKKGVSVFAIATGIFSVAYTSLFCSMSFVSIEVFVAAMLIPIIFFTITTKGFYYRMHCLRIIFILMFFSSALWKIRAGGIFNTEEMSAILLRQHSSYLVSNSIGWFSNLITYLVSNSSVAYNLYLFAFIAEFIFVIGFFTRRFDKYLTISFCLFALFDYLLMGINYFTWLPFLGCLYFSKYSIEKSVI